LFFTIIVSYHFHDLANLQHQLVAIISFTYQALQIFEPFLVSPISPILLSKLFQL
jgi:hypothetical protein